MQTSQDISIHPHAAPGTAAGANSAAELAARADYRILRRNGAVVPFEPNKISGDLA